MLYFIREPIKSISHLKHSASLELLVLLPIPAAASLVVLETVWVVLTSEEGKNDDTDVSAWCFEQKAEFEADPFPQPCTLLMLFISVRPLFLRPLSSSSSSEEALPSTALCRHSTSADREEMDSLPGPISSAVDGAQAPAAHLLCHRSLHSVAAVEGRDQACRCTGIWGLERWRIFCLV